MLALALALLFTTAALAAVLSLADSWTRAARAFARLSREAELARAGFVPVMAPREVRLRPAPRRELTPMARRFPRAAAPHVRLHGAA